jgi:hypothetical protein
MATGRQHKLVNPMQIKTSPNIQAQGLRGMSGPAANGIDNRKPNTTKT